MDSAVDNVASVAFRSAITDKTAVLTEATVLLRLTVSVDNA